MATSRIIQAVFKTGEPPELVGEPLLMLEDEVLRFKDDAMAQILSQLERALPTKTIKRIVYLDEDNDPCTLSKTTMEDALTFAKQTDPDSDLWLLELGAVLEEPELPVEIDLTSNAEAAPTVQEPPAEAGRAAAPPAPAPEPTHVWKTVECDGCAMFPLVGPRFKCTTRPDYDFCAACHARRSELAPGEEFEEVARPQPQEQEADLGKLRNFLQARGMEQERIEDQVTKLRALEAQFPVSISVLEEAPPPACAHSPFPKARPGSASGEAPVAAEVSQLVAAAEERLSERMRKMEEDWERRYNTLKRSQSAIDSLLSHPEKRVRRAAEVAMKEQGSDAEGAAADSDAAMESAVPSEPVPSAPVPSAPVPSAPVPEVSQELRLSARAVCAPQLTLGVEAMEEEAARGEANEEYAAALQSSGMRQAYRVGRVLMPTGLDTSVPACAKVIVQNDGEAPWPDTLVLTNVLGDDMGLPQVPLGAIAPGEAAEIVLELSIPAKKDPCSSTAAWAMIDAATSKPLGPVLFFEVIWQQ